MAPKPIPIQSAAVVDPTQLATIDWYSFWKSQSDAVTQLLNAAPPTTGSPLFAAQFGLTLQAPGEDIVALPSQPWLVRADDKHLFCGTAGTNPTGGAASIFAVDPVAGTIAANVSIGTWPTNEIRGIIVFGDSVYFVDRAAGKLYRLSRSTLSIIGTVTGFPTGSGAQGPFGICADLAYLFVGVSLTGASKLLKIDPALIPSNGSTVTLASVLYTGGTNTLVLGGDDTHNLCWDGGVSIWVTNLSLNNLLYRVNKNTMTLTSSLGANAGGAWGIASNGDRVFYSEISNNTVAYRRIGTSGIGGFINLPAGSGVADLQPVDDELWLAFSTTVNVSGTYFGTGTNPNAPNTVGAVAVYDILTGAQKRLMDNNGQHCPSLCPFGLDMWSSDSEGQFLHRWRRKSSTFSPFG